MNDKSIALRPSYWASVSGGKDSLYMLRYILQNLDRYPLDGVMHFELEIDYPFIHNVIDYMQAQCESHGIRFLRLKPEKTWEELYYHKIKNGRSIRGFPMRKARWCNEHYKLTAKKQLQDALRAQGFYIVQYIGYCADEENRFAKRADLQLVERYPLVEAGVIEDTIWQWAKTQPIFNDYYIYNKRCGCMYCPMSSYLNLAYLLKYYPENYQYMIDKIKETEEIRSHELGRPFAVMQSNPKYNAQYIDNIVRNKWLKILNEKENR